MSASSLDGRIALVTGAGVRVGRAIAVALGKGGADVAVHYRDSAGPAEEVVAEIRGAGRRATPLRADLASPQACRDLVRAAVSAFGALDLLVHSAANFHRASLDETDEALWDDAMNVNARAGFLLAREAAPTLRARGGRIVLVSDALALSPARGYAAHSVSKAAVEGLVRALAVELAPEVSVNGVAPGTILPPAGMRKDLVAKLVAEIPLRRCGTPEEIAASVAFFCDGPGFVTGQVLTVDGGRSLY